MCDTVSHIRKLKPVQSHLAYKILYIDTLAFSNIFHSLLWFPSVLWKEFKMSHIYSLVSFIYCFCLFFCLHILPQPSSQCIFQQVPITPPLVLSWSPPSPSPKSPVPSFQSKYLQFCTFYPSIFLPGDPNVVETHLDVVQIAPPQMIFLFGKFQEF